MYQFDVKAFCRDMEDWEEVSKKRDIQEISLGNVKDEFTLCGIKPPRCM